MHEKTEFEWIGFWRWQINKIVLSPLFPSEIGIVLFLVIEETMNYDKRSRMRDESYQQTQDTCHTR